MIRLYSLTVGVEPGAGVGSAGICVLRLAAPVVMAYTMTQGVVIMQYTTTGLSHNVTRLGYPVTVTYSDDRPGFKRIADHYRDEILTGKRAPGSLLPTQAEMMAEFAVSVTTVRDAIGVLRGEGLVDSARGRGVFVRVPPTVRVVSSSRYAEQLRKVTAGDRDAADSGFAHERGGHTSDTTIDCEFATVPAPKHVAEAFGLPEGEEVFQRYMVWNFDGLPEQIRTCYYPLDLVQGTPMTRPECQPWPGGVIAELAELGEVVDNMRERVRARYPLPDEAYRLRIPGGVPVLVVNRIGSSKTRRAVEVAEIILRADQNELDYHLKLDQP